MFFSAPNSWHFQTIYPYLFGLYFDYSKTTEHFCHCSVYWKWLVRSRRSLILKMNHRVVDCLGHQLGWTNFLGLLLNGLLFKGLFFRLPKTLVFELPLTLNLLQPRSLPFPYRTFPLPAITMVKCLLYGGKWMQCVIRWFHLRYIYDREHTAHT